MFTARQRSIGGHSGIAYAVSMTLLVNVSQVPHPRHRAGETEQVEALRFEGSSHFRKVRASG